MLLSEDVGKFKKENNITILQEEHWKKVISSRLDKAQDYQLSERFIRQLMDAMHQESIRHQLRVMNPSLPEKK
jgi:chorismate mutase